MARGNNKFDTMDYTTLKADNPNATLYKHNLEKPARDVDINGGPETKVHESDPMRDLMQKGLVHHMAIPEDMRAKCKGFVRDAINEAQASKSYMEKKMRGNTVFKGMEGFGIETKGGTDPECLPNKPGGDVLEEEKLSDKAKGKEPKKGGLKTEEDDLTFAKDVDLVGEKAKDDIADGYVSDIQGEKVSTAKGFEAFNKMVEKGIAADIAFNPHNVGATLDAIDAHTSVVMKSVSEGIEVKGKLGEIGRGMKEGWKMADEAAGGKLGRKIATNLGAQTAVGAGVGAGTAHLASDEQGKKEGAWKRGAKRGAVGGFLAGPIGGAIGGYTGRSTPAKRVARGESVEAEKCMNKPMKVKTAGGAFDEEEGPETKRKR